MMKRDTHHNDETHLPTLIAIGVIVYTLIGPGHEAGHYVIARLFDASCSSFSNAHVLCERSQLSVIKQSFILAAGTLFNLITGLGLLVWLRQRPPTTGPHYYLIWLGGVANIFMGAGYLLVDPIGGFGDWTEVIQLYKFTEIQGILFTFLGAIISFVGLFTARRLLSPLLPSGEERLRKQRAWLLCLLPYLAVGGAFTALVTSLNRIDWQLFIVTNALAMMGGTFFLAWLPAWIKEEPVNIRQVLCVTRSPLLMIIGGGCAILMLAVFGPAIILS